jgi:hypothetical protein
MVFRDQFRLGSEPVSQITPIRQSVVLVLQIGSAGHIIGGGGEGCCKGIMGCRDTRRRPWELAGSDGRRCVFHEKRSSICAYPFTMGS